MDRKPDFNRLEGTSRDFALEVLYYCHEKGMFAHKALTVAAVGKTGEKASRGAATEMSFGSIRRLISLDRAISQASGRAIEAVDPLLADILRIAVYQLLYMRKEASYAVVDSAVEQAKRLIGKGASGFANAVLRKVAAAGFALELPDPGSDPAAWLSVAESHPLWIVEDWTERFGMEAATGMCRYDNETPPAFVRVNSMKLTRDELIDRLAEKGSRPAPGGISPYAVKLPSWDSVASGDAFEEGLYSVQDQSSMLVAEMLAPKPGEFVIDMCAAPGGKTCHAAELAQDGARVLACDSNAKRLDLVGQNARRLSLKSVETMTADASKLHEKFAGKADAVMADVPCSGLGVLSRRPDARWRKDPSQTEEFAKISSSILDSAAQCLRPGGRLVFSTCTVSERENEKQLEDFLSRHHDFSPVPLKRLETLGISGEGSGYAQLLQGIHESDGFFIALLHKSN